jgi:hypothetical protein
MAVQILYGPHSSGKTVSLGLVYALLYIAGAKVRKAPKMITKTPKDFKAVLEYKGKIIAVFTSGDAISQCRAALNFGISEAADILVMAQSDTVANFPTPTPLFCQQIHKHKAHGTPGTSTYYTQSVVDNLRTAQTIVAQLPQAAQTAKSTVKSKGSKVKVGASMTKPRGSGVKP